jgi:hypothetical protein
VQTELRVITLCILFSNIILVIFSIHTLFNKPNDYWIALFESRKLEIVVFIQRVGLVAATR